MEFTTAYWSTWKDKVTNIDGLK